MKRIEHGGRIWERKRCGIPVKVREKFQVVCTRFWVDSQGKQGDFEVKIQAGRLVSMFIYYGARAIAIGLLHYIPITKLQSYLTNFKEINKRKIKQSIKQTTNKIL